ncbi:helix-turn-helix domain-containing protein [Nocardia vinacea]|uniref:helix-turn-helix domain-containing protein n=1 Tax=Nocardia vinacea TaxID=96468 RepID=UPI0012F6B8D1|nr:helix-turn-helix domain-containing protein [Nocardia vinacea]
MRQAVFAARMTPQQLAEKVEVDPKTVQRWIAQGRIPYPVHQYAVAVAVGVPEKELWPNTFEQSRYLTAHSARANAPAARDLAADSTESHVTWDPDHGEVLGGRSDWMKHRNDLSKSSAQSAIDAASAAWFADHPEREEQTRDGRDADAVHLAASQDLDGIQNARMRELMSWVPAPVGRSPLADYQPGSALANALDRSTEREGMER